MDLMLEIKAKLTLMARHKAWLIGLAAIGVVFYLNNRPRYTEFEEEVMLGDPPKLEIIKRRVVEEMGNVQLQSQYLFSRSELYLYGKKEPVWADGLWPLYLEKLSNDDGYLLVAGIEGSVECYQRGHVSYYVTIHVTRDSAKEVPTPTRLEGVPTNLLFRWGSIPKGMTRVSIGEKERLNNLNYSLEKHRKNILLNEPKIGC